MDQKMIDFCNNYKDKIQEITEKYSSEQEEMQEEIEKLESYVAGRIGRSKLEDEEKMEMLDLFTTEDAKEGIVQSLKSDTNKAKLLEQFHDQYFLVKIIKTIGDDDLKVDALKYVTSSNDKTDIFVTLKDKEKISSFLENDPDMKNVVVQYLKNHMRYRPGRLWDFMKNAGLENQIIPYMLFDSKYEILKKMDEGMKKDVEKYLGKPVPENIEEMSIYERVGVDLDALQGEVITSEEQLGLNQFQKRYLDLIDDFSTPKKGEPKRKVSIRDFEGSFSPTLADGVPTPKNWKELLCGLKRMGDNIEHHSENILFNPELNPHDESLSLECINGKYYMNRNGNHRMTLLKAKYLSEVKMANGDPERLAEIEEKYTIEASYVTELPSNANELMGINTLDIISDLKGSSTKIKELTEDGKKAGYIITNGNVTSIVKTEEELQKYLQQEIEQLKEIDDGQLFEKFNKKVQSLNLDYPENEEYRKAFEEMTGISLEQEKIKQEDSKEESFSINEVGEIIRENPSNAKMPEEEQPEMLKTREESFRDEIEQDDMQHQKQQEDRKRDVNLWMNRYKTYNSAIDRVSQNLKSKFIQMKSDIINEIKEKLKERTNQKQVQNTDGR